ncbi:EI24 domain-containing protein [Limnohabitans sp. 2KL-27]|uniref:EI24 domain-containing protein n=1 Tax=Limnohabitans sp. 2KL-27 TaxID=1100705 RepID=UPI000B0106ED|nr:EI24 domain-containing protein [Limnohabitans sp. 2KL-27]
MKLLIDSFWRAAMYCLYPRVIGLSFLPLVLIVALSWLLGYLYWDVAVTWVRGWLDASSWLAIVWRWLEGIGLPDLKTVVAPLLVIFSVTPLVVVASLLAVSFLMTPSLTRLVAERRFAGLQRKHGGSLARSLWWTLLSLLLALGALLLTLPMWLVPPLAMVLPALIWGWLTYRVMAFDVLAEFASAEERHSLMARHRMSFLSMGVVTGLMGAAPSLVWASGAVFAAAFVILVPVAIWIYTLVFAFSSLWFAHFALTALQALRHEPQRAAVDDVLPAVPASPHATARLGPDPDDKADSVTDVQPSPSL